MDESDRLEKDPVCGMMVDHLQNQIMFRGVSYAFCSQQCRERFAAAPGLYVGRRRLLAPKQKGMEVIKRRRLALGSPLAKSGFAGLRGALLSMMGVMAVRPVETLVERSCDLLLLESATRATVCIEAVEISYDLLQVTAEQLERKITEHHAPPSDGWGEKLQRDFIRYLEKCELDDLEIRDTGLARCARRARRSALGFARDARD